jgi:subfamily B ATP-binding cassette protein MsbA
MKTVSEIKKIWSVIHGYRRRATLVILVFTISSFIEAIGLALLLPLLEDIIKGEASGRFAFLLKPFLELFPARSSTIVILAVLFLLIILKNMFIILKTKISADFIFGIWNRWTTMIFGMYTYSRYNFLLDQKQGVLMNNLIVEPGRALECINKILEFISKLILTSFMLLILFIASWKVTLFSCVIVAIFLFTVKNTINKYVRNVGKKKISYAQKMSSYASEMITGIRQVKTFSLESEMLKGFRNFANKYANLIRNFKVINVLPQCAGELLIFGVIVLGAIYVVFLSTGDLKGILPILGLFVFVGQRIIAQVGSLVQDQMRIGGSLDSLYLVDSLIRKGIEKEELGSGKGFEKLTGDIVLEEIGFRYPNSSVVLDGLNMTIPRGRVTFVLGGSGSGKSTIVDLLLRLQKPNSGRIFVNGVDLEEYSIASWRHKIGFVSQDVLLFNTTIRENILSGKPDANDEELSKAARDVNADKFIMDFPEGYQTVVGDRGLKLSGGQRQRVVLARSLIRNPEVLIFDEATSALDQELEREIIETIKADCKGKTIIFITHRLAAARYADLIYLLENGRISRYGKYEEVFANPNHGGLSNEV